MAKCSKCGRKGLFLKLENGLCNECVATERHREEIELLEKQKAEIQECISVLNHDLENQQALYDKIVEEAKAAGVEQAQEVIKEEQERAEQKLQDILSQTETAQAACAQAREEEARATKSACKAIAKVEKAKGLIYAINHAQTDFLYNISEDTKAFEALAENVTRFLKPTVTLELQCLTMRDLRKRYKENEKLIAETLEKYRRRYNTKANQTIYHLMVIALGAELQNVLYNIKFGKLDQALSEIKELTAKYYTIAADGNQNIAPTMRKFIGEIDYYYQEAVKIEYEYYVQKERAKEEQRAIREQMRQEAEERKALEAERKKIEKEESKFQGQITSLESQLESTEDVSQIAQLESRLAELRAQLDAINEKKEEIATLQNGKAGNVYVISNLGSFGEDVFKIGMTRRLEPQERIDELSSASVPFPFDVHSFIFSDDAVALEGKIHKILNAKRVNKVNLRKEFFRISLDELEKLVGDLAPTAEFRRTMLAEQYHQSISIEEDPDYSRSVTDDTSDDEAQLAV